MTVEKASLSTVTIARCGLRAAGLFGMRELEVAILSAGRGTCKQLARRGDPSVLASGGLRGSTNA